MTVNHISPRKRPDVMQGSTYKITTAYGNLYVTINEDQYGPFEVFSQLGKAGGFFGAQTEAICRMISLALRSGISIDQCH
jgi:ribonucleoside-diphosphate reductase alpha chain